MTTQNIWTDIHVICEIGRLWARKSWLNFDSDLKHNPNILSYVCR